jgi:hypothetical protein
MIASRETITMKVGDGIDILPFERFLMLIGHAERGNEIMLGFNAIIGIYRRSTRIASTGGGGARRAKLEYSLN